MNRIKTLLFLLVITLSFFSCNKSKDADPTPVYPKPIFMERIIGTSIDDVIIRQHFSYNQDGNLLQVVDSSFFKQKLTDTRTELFTYDATGKPYKSNVTQYFVNTNQTGSFQKSFFYENDQLKSVQFDNGTNIKFTHDVHGNITETVNQYRNSTIKYKNTFKFDTEGNLIEREYLHITNNQTITIYKSESNNFDQNPSPFSLIPQYQQYALQTASKHNSLAVKISADNNGNQILEDYEITNYQLTYTYNDQGLPLSWRLMAPGDTRIISVKYPTNFRFGTTFSFGV